MKKVLFLVLVTLLMVGCGAGGGTTTSGVSGDGGGGGNGGGVVPSGPVGTITVTFPGSPAPQAAVYVTDPTPPLPGFAPMLEKAFRVTASRYETTSTIVGYTGDDPPEPILSTVTTRTFFVSADNTVPGSVTLQVPVYTGPNGYLIEVVSFSDNVLNPSFDNVFDPSSTQMIRYGHLDNVQITETGGVNAITLYPIAHQMIRFSSSDLITALTEYSMLVTYNTVTLSGRVPLRNNFNFLDNTSNTFVFPSNVTDNASLTYTVGRSFTRTAPAGFAGDNVYFQGQFYISDSMLTDGEERGRLWRKYRLNAPDLTIHNPIYQGLNQPGTIIITF
ncbi:MAG: hypothetical protein HW408_364 [Actinobacteria bacterium]|nr:hypothetical protein [Actinomycetota bacterium]